MHESKEVHINMNNKVTILCSGFGLGFYVPGLLIREKLKQNEIKAEILVFENIMQQEKKINIENNKKMYHKNFSVALLAQRMRWDIRESIDEILLEKVLQTWHKEKRRNFIVLSGHWVYVLNKYKERNPRQKINVDLLYIDSELSPSWKSLKKFYNDYNKYYNEVWLFNSQKDIDYYLPVIEQDPIPYNMRPNRFMIHGGGWGMGTYQDIIPELESNNLDLDIIVYEREEAESQKENNRYYMIDDSWSAWQKNNNNLFEFPPFGEIKKNETPKFISKSKYHSSYDIVKEAKAIISKPGGGTLIDSFSAATPLILLESFGKHEKRNSDLWEELGFGISYKKWKGTNYSLEILEKLHKNMVTKRQYTTNYISYYIEKNFNNRGCENYATKNKSLS